MNLITSSEQHHKMLLLFGGPQLPFDNTGVYSINRFVVAAVGKIYKICSKKLCDLGARAPWLTNLSTLTLCIKM